MSLVDFAKSELDIIGLKEDDGKEDEDLDDLAWEIIFDLINLRLISDSISVEDPRIILAHKFILKRIKNR